MTRKRCCKLLIGAGLNRNEAKQIMRTTPGNTNRDRFDAVWPPLPVLPPPGISRLITDLSNTFLQVTNDSAKILVSIRMNHK